MPKIKMPSKRVAIMALMGAALAAVVGVLIWQLTKKGGKKKEGMYRYRRTAYACIDPNNMQSRDFAPQFSARSLRDAQLVCKRKCGKRGCIAEMQNAD